MAQGPPRLGQLLISAGLIDEATLEAALLAQEKDGCRLGEALVREGHVSEAQLTQVLSMQYSVAWVSLDLVQFTPALLELVSAELAHQHKAIPVHTRIDSEGCRILYVAMDDPMNIDAMREISAYANMNVRPMIAPPSELARVINSNYRPSSHKATKRMTFAS